MSGYTSSTPRSIPRIPPLRHSKRVDIMLKRRTPENDLQNSVVNLFRHLGYTVMETGKGRSKTRCRCGAWVTASGWQGNTVGLPDLYIHRPSWGVIALPIEMKTPTGQVRPAQKALADAGVTTICRSIDDVVNTVAQFEQRFRLESESLRRFRETNGYSTSTEVVRDS